jgi:hypothetical protein
MITDLDMATRPSNPALAIANIRRSNDLAWLQQFRLRMAEIGDHEVLAAIDERLAELREVRFHARIGVARPDMTLVERVHESVRVYEEFLARKHSGRRVRAARTRDMIRRWGEKEAVRRTVANMHSSNGLELLAEHGRLDCAYEQIVLDFSTEFDPGLARKARANLARLPTHLVDDALARSSPKLSG